MAGDFRIGPQRTLAAPTTDQARLRGAAQDFESLLVGTMLRTMRQTTKSMAGSDDDSATGAGIMSDVMDEHLATALAHAGGMGLGKLLAGQLELQRQRQEPVSEPETPVDHTLRKEKP
jgi:flagellar protein FlgJ